MNSSCPRATTFQVECQSPIIQLSQPNLVISPEMEIPFSKTDNLRILNPTRHAFTFKKLFITQNYLITDRFHINLTNLSLSFLNSDMHSSLIFTNNNEIIYLFGSREKVRIIYRAISKYVIQHDFNQKYKRIKLLGKGSFAKVYKCQSYFSKEYCAVKIIKKRSNNGKYFSSDAVQLEVDILRKLDHPNIMKLFEVFENEDKIFIVVDLLSGGELLQSLHSQKYDESLIQNIIWKLLQACLYLHQQNIMHRDLKLENIILRSKDSLEDIVIVDFGLADYYNLGGKYLFPKCGTLGYVAPELFQEGANYDVKVDIFGIGIIMFILLSGESPFIASSSQDTFIKNEKCKINFNLLMQKQVSESAIKLCQNLLNPNPQLRFSASRALDDDWFTIQLSPTLLTLDMDKIPIFQVNRKCELLQNSPIWSRRTSQTPIDSSPISCLSQNGSLEAIDQDYVDERQYFKNLAQGTITDCNLDDSDSSNGFSSPANQMANHSLVVKHRQQP